MDIAHATTAPMSGTEPMYSAESDGFQARRILRRRVLGPSAAIPRDDHLSERPVAAIVLRYWFEGPRRKG